MMTGALQLHSLPGQAVAYRGRLADVAACGRFMAAGNATLTVVSQRTGQRFTYRFRRPEPEEGQPRPVWVGLLSGPDNENDYRFMGTIFGDKGWTVACSKKSGVLRDAPSFIALDWLMRCMREGSLRGIEVWHEGRCGRCGRKLTVPESVASGFGPDCAGRV